MTQLQTALEAAFANLTNAAELAKKQATCKEVVGCIDDSTLHARMALAKLHNARAEEYSADPAKKLL